MPSLFDELTEKLARDPRLTKRGGPRFDLSLLLFNARADLRALWRSSEEVLTQLENEGRTAPEALRSAVDRLRPIFGDRS